MGTWFSYQIFVHTGPLRGGKDLELWAISSWSLGTPETASSSSMFKPTRARFSCRQTHYLENTRDKPSLSPKDDFNVYVVFMHGFAWFYFTKEKKRGLGDFRSYIGPLSFSGPSCVCKAPGPGFFLFFFCLIYFYHFSQKKKKK